MTNKTKRIHQMTIPQWEKAFPTEEACQAYLVAHRWPVGVRCPRCGNVEVKEHGTIEIAWLCNVCSPSGTNYRFSVIAGTIFENTNKPLRDWFRVIHMMLTSKKGVSALQIHRTMGFGSYKTAWYMCHRVRAGARERGIPQADGHCRGGRDLHRRQGQEPALAASTASWRHRRQDLSSSALSSARATSLPACLDRVDHGRHAAASSVEMVSDQGFACSPRTSTRATVALSRATRTRPSTISQQQYVVGAIHTNTIEGFWSLFKRGVVGTYHKVSKKYLPLYVADRRQASPPTTRIRR